MDNDPLIMTYIFHLSFSLIVESSLGKLVGGVVSGANAVALHSFNNDDPYFNNGRETYWPAMGQNFNGMGMYWLKAKGSFNIDGLL